MQQFNYDDTKEYHHFTIKGWLPDMNEYLSACAKHPLQGVKMKRDAKYTACNAIRQGIRNWKTDRPLVIHYVFYERNKKRDKDNIAFMVTKAVHDALQACKVIGNDGWKNIENFTFDFYVDKENPRIEVYLEEVD